jgi:hypothetical protein
MVSRLVNPQVRKQENRTKRNEKKERTKLRKYKQRMHEIGHKEWLPNIE